MDHLIEGHDYNFRVKAVNKFGESMPLAMSSPITAKDPYAKPDKPGAPEPTGKLLHPPILINVQNTNLFSHGMFNLFNRAGSLKIY